MNKHLTDIQLFEYANDLITDQALLVQLKEHIGTCEQCQLSLKTEKRIDAVIKKELVVEQQVDVRKSVVDYFAKPSVKVVGVDVSWMILMVLFVSGLLIIGQLSSYHDLIPNMGYATSIATAVSALLIVDFFIKYRKNKKNATS